MYETGVSLKRQGMMLHQCIRIQGDILITGFAFEYLTVKLFEVFRPSEEGDGASKLISDKQRISRMSLHDPLGLGTGQVKLDHGE